MPRHRKIVLLVLTGFLLALFFVAWFCLKPPAVPVRKQEVSIQKKSDKPAVATVIFEPHPLALELTAGLNQPEKSAQDDLQALAQILYTFRQSFKENPIGQNDDVTAALLGGNEKHIQFLSKETAPVRDGKLVDRWGTPYGFHPLSGQKMELRSAGPDREMFTPDDILLE
ncbi:hypothetical protein BH11VER1_BH11VER1_19200 [soil metagenome]